MDIAGNIQVARMAQAMTQEDLAAALQVDCLYVDRLEFARVKPSAVMARRLADVLHVSADLFLAEWQRELS